MVWDCANLALSGPQGEEHPVPQPQIQPEQEQEQERKEIELKQAQEQERIRIQQQEEEREREREQEQAQRDVLTSQQYHSQKIPTWDKVLVTPKTWDSDISWMQHFCLQEL